MKTRLLSWILVAIMTVIIPAISGCAQNPTQLSTPLLKFKKMTYTDNGGTGIEAFSFLMPSD
jgi:hypothetical protein